jgi:hypothetical protein
MPGSRNPVRRDRAIEALLAGSSIIQAAEHARVNERTLRHWLDDPDFAAQLDDARHDQLQRVSTALASAALVAVRVLIEAANNERVPWSVRIAAAGRLLATAPAWTDRAVLDERVAQVERALTDRHLSVVPP